MKQLKWVLCALFIVAGVCSGEAFEYTFQNSLRESSGGPALAPFRDDPPGSFAFADVFGKAVMTYSISDEQWGLSLEASSFIGRDYSIEVVFRPLDHSALRLVNFRGLADSLGLYVYPLGGGLAFVGRRGLSADTVAHTDKFNHAVFARSARTGEVQGYLNGQLGFDLLDDEPISAVSTFYRNFVFFSNSGASVALLRIYPHLLTRKEVRNLFLGLKSQ